ncbi:diguanylate cyclase (GGDEF) domain-containing protein [Parafrankia irregularis]|uniref:Diguanylate cyclase (GGDEF) domain-containing protein n=1 Tax=Parafrankia irregularis TaxID=795642 RepID=A0A0S4QI20_9ACTN|nr:MULTISPECIES: EAL domain-containing protein [Parafrankia]MBE3204000.1 EAL domain-containing protein [Parafrankia sp. CH37]CUU55123.1 diguanylate cyclase (GGDEF) domain-containing protein [Parafrankia irregularis]
MAWLWTHGAVPDRAAGDRAFFVGPPLIGSIFLLLLAVMPGSPDYLQPGALAAASLGAVTVAATCAAPARWLRRLTLASCVGMTSVVAAMLAMAGSDELAITLLFWFPWAGGQAGLAWNRLGVVMAQAVVMTALVLGVFSVNGRLTEYPLAAVGSVLGVLAAGPLAHGSFRWGRTRTFTDSLTALASRPGLIQAADPLIAGRSAAGCQTVLMVVDLDHFKEINTAFGYEAGDDVLRTFGRWLRLVRPPPLLTARLGGDKFALLLPGEPAPPGAAGAGWVSPGPETADPALADLGRDVLRQLDGRLRIGGVDVEVEATAGLTSAPACGKRVIELLSCADAALADARRSGERVGVWTTGMAAVRPWELALHAELRSAIDQGELELYYQPMAQAATGQIVGVEALMRWRHPSRGLLPPGSFLPMAERSSLIVELTWWELDEALHQCARWRAEGIPVAVSANLSPRLLVVDALPKVVAGRLAAYDLPPDVLTLEITENALVSQPARAAAMLSELRVSGVKLSMDDFGTGYNSMEILKALTFDEIKIDRSFVVDAQGSLPDMAIVRSVVDLGHRLGLRVVGEGIEDESSERILTELGCDVLQGYAVSVPLPARELTPLLAAGSRSAPAAGPGPDSPDRRACPTAQTSRKGQTSRNGQASRNGQDPWNGQTSRNGQVSPNGKPARATSATRTDAGDEHAAVRGVTPSLQDRWALGGLPAPVPADEDSRLAALRRYHILDTPAEPEFDEVVVLAAQIADCANAYVVFVDADREWFKSSHGRQIVSIPGRSGVAAHAVWSGEYLEIADAARDVRFAHVVESDPPAPVRFFAAAPLRTSDGHVLGALCVADRMPRQLAPGQRHALGNLAAQTMRLCEARRDRMMSEQAASGLERLDQFWHPDDLPAAATLIADVIRALVGADAVGVMMAKIPGATVFEAAGWSVAPGTEPMTKVGARATPDDEAALRALSKLRAPLFVPDPAGTPLIPNERVDRLKIGSAMVVPMPDEGGLLGFVTVRWTQPIRAVEPSVMRAVTMFATPARCTLARLRWMACRPAPQRDRYGRGA